MSSAPSSSSKEAALLPQTLSRNATIDLTTPLSLEDCFRFPCRVRSRGAKYSSGPCWLLVPGLGWLLNMGPGFLIGAATVAIPGSMSHYCRRFEAREIFDPVRALRRRLQGGLAYWRAWLIALCALAISFAGLLFAGVGFLVSSVWFWQVAGFGFATVMTQRFGLAKEHADAPDQ